MGTDQKYSAGGIEQNLIPVDYIDHADGLHKRVLLPPGSTNFDEGIPLGMSLDELYGDCPLTFRKRLSDELYAHGLIEPRDFLQPGAAERVRSAFIGALHRDVTDIIELARREFNR